MAKRIPLGQNKTVGHFVALLFFVAVGYFFYAAAANMNYVWKWNSVPKYFAYDETISIEAPIDGKLVLESNKYFIQGDEKVEVTNLDSSFSFDYEVGEDVYEGDYIASKEELHAGPILSGLWVTLKISFFAMLLTLVILLLSNDSAIALIPIGSIIAKKVIPCCKKVEKKDST